MNWLEIGWKFGWKFGKFGNKKKRPKIGLLLYLD